MRPNGGLSSSATQNMHASMGQYSIHAGDPAQPVQQSVVMARMRGFLLRVALPSPTDIGDCFSTMSNTFNSSTAVMRPPLTQRCLSLDRKLWSGRHSTSLAMIDYSAIKFT